MVDKLGIEAIMEYIRTTALPKINGEGNYYHNLQYISRSFESPDEVGKNNMPAAIILNNETGCKIIPLTSEEMTVGSSLTQLTNAYPVEILGYVLLMMN